MLVAVLMQGIGCMNLHNIVYNASNRAHSCICVATKHGRMHKHLTICGSDCTLARQAFAIDAVAQHAALRKRSSRCFPGMTLLVAPVLCDFCMRPASLRVVGRGGQRSLNKAHTVARVGRSTKINSSLLRSSGWGNIARGLRWGKTGTALSKVQSLDMPLQRFALSWLVGAVVMSAAAAPSASSSVGPTARVEAS